MLRIRQGFPLRPRQKDERPREKFGRGGGGSSRPRRITSTRSCSSVCMYMRVRHSRKRAAEHNSSSSYRLPAEAAAAVFNGDTRPLFRRFSPRAANGFSLSSVSHAVSFSIFFLQLSSFLSPLFSLHFVSVSSCICVHLELVYIYTCSPVQPNMLETLKKHPICSRARSETELHYRCFTVLLYARFLRRITLTARRCSLIPFLPFSFPISVITSGTTAIPRPYTPKFFFCSRDR